MILTTQDKNEFLKAALKSEDPGLARWLTAVVDALDSLPDGKQGAPCPPYQPPNPSPRWEDRG
ncbi:MAG TPA: hypothetical protein VIV12_02420 [Streptosporangiaceae bacterium]